MSSPPAHPNGAAPPERRGKTRDLPGPAARRISRNMGRAIGDYGLVAEGDRILIAVSGGKDSLTLLHMLAWRQRFAPVAYTLHAAHVVSDRRSDDGGVAREIAAACERLGVPLAVRPAAVLARSEGPVNCFWCATVRRSVLFELARELGCNKLALGHHLDDIAETVLLNLFFHGNFSTMVPCQPLFAGEVTLIRPLAYVQEDDIIRFAESEAHFVTDTCRCPEGDDSQRKAMKAIIRTLGVTCPAVRQNILRAMHNIRTEYLA